MANTDAGRAGFGRAPFDEWLTAVASELTQDLSGRHRYEIVAPGSVSEAAAYLLSDAGLAPDEDGYPTLADQGGIARADDFEALATVLYAAAFP